MGDMFSLLSFTTFRALLSLFPEGHIYIFKDLLVYLQESERERERTHMCACEGEQGQRRKGENLKQTLH